MFEKYPDRRSVPYRPWTTNNNSARTKHWGRYYLCDNVTPPQVTTLTVQSHEIVKTTTVVVSLSSAEAKTYYEWLRVSIKKLTNHNYSIDIRFSLACSEAINLILETKLEPEDMQDNIAYAPPLGVVNSFELGRCNHPSMEALQANKHVKTWPCLIWPTRQ